MGAEKWDAGHLHYYKQVTPTGFEESGVRLAGTDAPYQRMAWRDGRALPNHGLNHALAGRVAGGCSLNRLKTTFGCVTFSAAATPPLMLMLSATSPMKLAMSL
jgi:hypothetical protein